MKKTKYLLFLLFMLTICVVNVKSIKIGKPSGRYNNYGVKAPMKYDENNNKVYCSEFYKTEPTNGMTCDVDSSWDKTSFEARVIGEIINSQKAYSTKEVAINYYLGNHSYSYDGRSGVKIVEKPSDCTENTANYICMKNTNSIISDFVSEMETRVSNKMNNSVKIEYVNGFKYSNGTFNAIIRVSNYDGTSVSVSGHGMNCTVTKNNNPGSFNVSCEYLGEEDKVYITITATRTFSYYTSIRYNCGEAYQKIFTSQQETGTSTATDTQEKLVNTTQQACNNKLQGADSVEKIKIYKEYKSKGYDWRKILDFRNSSCDKFETNYKMTQTCNNIDINVNDFDWYNVSGYQETTTIGDKAAYCVVEFNYNNNLPRSGVFDAGKIILQDLDNLGKATLQKRCYAYGVDTSADWKNSVDFDISSYIKGMSILDQDLEQSIYKKEYIHDTPNKFIVRYNLQYLKLNYLEKVNGLATTKEWCNKNAGGCIERKGIVTNFEKKKDNNATYAKSFYPEVTLAGKYADQSKKEYKPEFKVEKSDNCNYRFNKQMIKNNEPNLVFRIIDTKNPFSGKTGNGRVIGSNWCEGGYNCTSEGIEDYSGLKLIQDNIINKPNSSGLNSNGTKATPKYTINLNYDTMKSIREYNKEHNYNSFEQKCDETKKCSSKFINEYLK